MTDDIINEGPILFIDVSASAVQEQIVEISSEPVTKCTESTKTPGVDSKDVALLVQARKIRCSICNRYSAENEEKMMRHVRKVHRGENPFQCYMCDYSTYNKSLFEEHVRMHQGIKPFKCSYCSYRSVSKKNTKKHELIHRPDNPLGCSQCPFIARNGKCLNSHRTKKHSNIGNEVSKCVECDTSFPDQETYEEHLNNRKSCQKCDAVLCKELLKVHKREVHGIVLKKKAKPHGLQCKVCKWSTNSKPRFLLHLIHHPNQDLSDCSVDLTVLRKYGILPVTVAVAD